MIKSVTITSFRGNKDVLLPKCKSNLALIHPSSMEKLQLKLGSLLLVKNINGHILFKSWPYELLEESSIALPGASLFQHYATSKSCIEQYMGDIVPADRVIFSPKEYKTFMDTKSFKTFLRDYLECVHLKEGMILHLAYLGYPCCFTVKKIYSYIMDNNMLLSSDFPNHTESMDDCSIIEKSFSEKCNISNSFKHEKQFQSSTPISSPKILLQNKLCSEKQQLVFSSEEFYYVHKNTQTFVAKPNCVQKQQPGVRFEDIGSLTEQINYIKTLVDSLLSSGSDAQSKGIFIVGPSGTGKSMIAKAIQTEYKHELSIYLVNKNLFRSQSRSIVQLKKAFKDAEENSPSILILDDIDQLFEGDTFSSKTKNEKELPPEVSSLLHNLLISIPGILVIATSQNKSSIHDNLQKRVVLEKEIRLSIPSTIDRMQILSKILRKYENILSLQEVSEISEMAHGFTGADLQRLCEKATDIAYQGKSFDRLTISFLDLKKSLNFIKPSSIAELGFEVPNVRWSDIGGMEEVKNAVKEMVDWPLKYPVQFKKLGITPSRGILMYGPPGCCKTMIAKALAAESQLNFIYIKDSQVFSMYVGDSEKSVSDVFKKARSASPCVMFFDEIESVAPKRDSSNGSSVADRVVTQILIEIDGIDVLQEGVCIIAATNQPHRIDPSLLRPGRLDHMIYVPLPDASTRKEIFEVILRTKPVSSEVDISYLVNKTEGYTGAEISDICSQACMHLIKEDVTSTTSLLSTKHFVIALESTKPRTTPEMIAYFENYRSNKNF